MNKRLILWTCLTTWFLLLGGIIFDTLVIAANWKSGTIEEVKTMQIFFHVTNPGHYFIIKPFVFLSSIVSVIGFRKESGSLRLLVATAFALIVVDLALTALLFDPIIRYASGPLLDASVLKSKAALFFNVNFLRILLDGGGALAISRALHTHYLQGAARTPAN